MGHLEIQSTDHFEGMAASHPKGQTRAEAAHIHHRSHPMRDLTLNQQEQARIKVLNSILEYQLPIAQAAEIMGVSERHAKRLLAAYRRDGPAALSHGNWGRRPHNAVPEATAGAVVILAGEKYAGFNHSHLTEALAEREGIHLSRQTVSRLLNRSGLTSARRHRPPKHRVRRERMPQEGMLLQIDGSHHHWLEERGPRFVLLLAVYDATGAVAQAVFRPSEDTRGYLALLEALIRQWGIPLALYSDRHAAFKYNARQGSVLFESTQFAQVARELGNRQIFALSPQAKGRVERMAATFQDWLVTELRLAGATDIGQANELLQEFLPGSTPSSPWPRSSRTRLTAGARRTVFHRDHQSQAHPQGGPGQHGQIPLEGPATAARKGAAQLLRSPGGGPGAGRR